MAPGKEPGNWEGKLGVGDDGSVTALGSEARKPGLCRDYWRGMS
ncbi:hypothetical protein C4J95_2153 [Pseudomonas orientalis]|nr:hypothetical protein C4J95_2153 [Pseudomonas orientalis]